MSTNLVSHPLRRCVHLCIKYYDMKPKCAEILVQKLIFLNTYQAIKPGVHSIFVLQWLKKIGSYETGSVIRLKFS